MRQKALPCAPATQSVVPSGSTCSHEAPGSQSASEVQICARGGFCARSTCWQMCQSGELKLFAMRGTNQQPGPWSAGSALNVAAGLFVAGSQGRSSMSPVKISLIWTCRGWFSSRSRTPSPSPASIPPEALKSPRISRNRDHIGCAY